MTTSRAVTFARRIQRRVGRMAFDTAFEALPRVMSLHPAARAEGQEGLDIVRDVPYRETGSPFHRLDVYRPASAPGLLPMVLYLHGGGFRLLSKDSHALIGITYARRGFVVFNMSYRLAPKHRYPAAIEDTCEALCWLLDNAERFGGDLARLIIAGESAGANLATSVAICTATRRPEPFARRAFDSGIAPRGIVPLYGLFQVTDIERFGRQGVRSRWIQDHLSDVKEDYLPPQARPEEVELADPVLLLERSPVFERPLPPFYVPVGTADPLADDTRRLEAALLALKVPCKARYFPGETHAFHALLWRPAARECWREMVEFMRANTR